MSLELQMVHFLHCMLAISNPDIHKVAAYEPLVFLGQKELKGIRITMHRFDQDVAEGNMADAMETGIKVQRILNLFNVAAFRIDINFQVCIEV